MAVRRGILLLMSALFSLTASQELVIAPSGDVQTKPLGENIVFTCSVTDLSPDVDANLKWFDTDNREIQLTSGSFQRRVYIEAYGHHTLKLYITNIQNSDAGTYSCRGDIEGEQEKRVTLEIFQDITFEHAPSPQYPKNGTDEIIACRVTGQPQPSVSWRYNGQILVTGGRYEVIPNEGLRIFDINKAMDDGDYTCRAEVAEDGRMDQRVITVEVHIAPKMEEMVKEQTGIEGQEASLTCHASGLPPPKYEFYKNDEQHPVQPSERVIIDADGGAIHFRPLQKGDEGDYRCMAFNDVGDDSATGHLNVLVPPHIHTLINQTAQEGQSQTLICRADGNPAPTMTFQKVGNEQPYEIGDDNEGGDVILRNDEAGVLEMTVQNLSPEDTANYTCIAQNEAGEHKLNGTLIVHYSPRFDSNHPTEFYLWAGKTRNITCFSQCEPEPVIRWYKDGKELQNNETFRIYNMKKNSNLQITCREEDQGWIYGVYTCEAENGVGKGQIDLNVLRARLPGAPQGVTVREESPTLLVLDVTPPADDGGIPIYGYRVQYEQSIQDFGLGEPVRIENLRPATTYLFQIMAKNEVGVGNALTYSHTTEAMREPYAIEPISDVNSLYPYEYDLQWEVPKTGGMPIEEYEFKIRKVKVGDSGQIVEPLEDWIRSLRNDNPQQPMTSYRFKNLSPDSYHQVEVRARNSIGWSEPNPEFVFRTAEGPSLVESKADEAGAAIKPAGLSTGAVIGIIIIVFLIFLVIVDISCYFMNGCGVLMCICVNLCGKPQPMNKEKAMEEGESKEVLKQPVEEAIVAQEQDVIEEEADKVEEAPQSPPAQPEEDEKKPLSEDEKLNELEPEDKDQTDKVIEEQTPEPVVVKDGQQEDEVEADEKTPLNEDTKVKEQAEKDDQQQPAKQEAAVEQA